MNFNIFELYRVFAIIGLIFLIKQIVFLCNKHKNSTYFALPFWLCFGVWTMETLLFLLADAFGKPNGLNNIEPQGVRVTLFVFLLIQVVMTVLMYLFCGRYAVFNIVYMPKKRRKPLMVNFDESYIVFYGLFKLNKKKIYIRDISIEDSAYIMQFAESKLFPYAAIIGAEEYFFVQLKNGKSIKICNKCGILSGSTVELIKLAKTLGIKFES